MSKRRKKSHLSPLEAKLNHLNNARELAVGVVSQEDLEKTLQILETATARRSLSSEHTVIGFFGATGSGKSALFNAVTGQELARTAATRPTTSEVKAAVWGEAGASDLLDWLEVGERHVILPGDGTEFSYDRQLEDGLILLDLPDFDSIESRHREIVERMTGLVDVLVWVLDPQKYADAALHHDFLIPLSTHEGVTVVVLNQIDKLPDTQVNQVVDSLKSILRSEGISPQHLVTTSAVSSQGVPELKKILQNIVGSKQAANARLLADVHSAADDLMSLAGGQHRLHIHAKETNRLVDRLASAAHVPLIAEAAAGSYRFEARKRTGWAFTRWIGGLRIDPLQRLHLKQQAPKNEELDLSVHRSSLPSRSAASSAKADSAVRDFLAAVTADAPPLWQKAMRETTRENEAHLEEEIDQAVVTTDLGAHSKSWWWYIFNTFQWIAMLATLVGIGWLLAFPVAGFFQFTLPEAPTVENWPVPTLLVAGGVVLGIFLALTAKLFVMAGSRQRQRSVTKKLRTNIKKVVEQRVLSNLNAIIDRYHSFNDELTAASRGSR